MEGRANNPASEWRELYKAALLEDDNAKIPQRIAEAERALAARARAPFDSGENQAREQQAMENAIYFLCLLRKLEARATVPNEQLCPALACSQPLA